MIADIAGGAVATNGVYAEIIPGVGFGSASVGISVTYYSTPYSEWQYCKAPIKFVDSPYTYCKQKKPWELNLAVWVGEVK